MHIKYSPCEWNPHAKIDAEPDTKITVIDENTLSIDGGERLFFDPSFITYEDANKKTEGKILEAHRDESNELYVTVRRFYTRSCSAWDNGKFNEVNP